MIKKTIKKIIPPQIFLYYHWLLARLANYLYFSPSQKIIVIGVTGTNGKTSTVNLIAQYLEACGKKVGLISTANIKVAGAEELNKMKMTMPGRLMMQSKLRQMCKQKCSYAVIESSSQGIEQFRHLGINFDCLVLTNLSPEHIEAHGSFENYRAAKEKLFHHLSASKRKKINGQDIPKIIISNIDDDETQRLQKIRVDKFVGYSIDKNSEYQATQINFSHGLEFQLNGRAIKADLLGKFNVYNVLAALATTTELGCDINTLSAHHPHLALGRQELIDQGQNFLVMIDYAPEPHSLQNLYDALAHIDHRRLIHVLGSCGGGRDKARQPILGAMAGEKADLVIVTNEDPYDDDPEAIIAAVAQGAIEVGKSLNHNLFKISDRRQAIRRALDLAKEDDLVLITGKGAEQFICLANGKKMPWDDREVAKEELQQRKKANIY